jgi:hypothetical protein
VSVRVGYDYAFFVLFREEQAEASRASRRDQAKREGLAIELARVTIASPHHHEEQSVLMTSVSILGRHSRSNQHYSSILNGFGRGPCHGGELRGLCPLPIPPNAQQHGIGARQLRAFDVALRVPHSVLQDEAIRLQIALLQQADPVIVPWTSRAYGKCAPKGCWHAIGVTLGELFPLLVSTQRCYPCS